MTERRPTRLPVAVGLVEACTIALRAFLTKLFAAAAEPGSA
jgi:hypothetical protein